MSGKCALVLTVITAFFLPQSVRSATYYVDQKNPQANAHNPGTESRPWNTIQRAVDAASPGDIVYIKEGVYHERVSLTGTSGTEGRSGDATHGPIRYIGAPGEQVILDGSGFHLTGSAFVSGRNAAGGRAVSDIEIKNVTVRNYPGPGIEFNAASGGQKSQDVTWENITAHHNGQDGLRLEGSTAGVTIRQCVAHNNGGNGIALEGTGPPTSPVPSGTQNALVEENLSFRNEESGIRIGAGWQGVTVRGNSSYFNRVNGLEVQNVRQSLFENNYVYANGLSVLTPTPQTSSEPADWKHAGWGGGGYFWSCAFDPSDHNILYLGSDVGGVYKSRDNGQTWHFMNKGLHFYAVHTIAVSPSDPRVLYVMTEDGMAKSRDGARTWEPLAQTRRGQLDVSADRPSTVRAIAVDPTNADIVYAGNRKGQIYKSEDGGSTWKRISPGALEGGVIATVAVSHKRPSLLFAASTQFGILRSQDAGVTWTRLTAPSKASSVCLSPVDENIVYAAFGTEGVRKSTNKGATWENNTLPITANIREVAIDPQNPDLVYCAGQKEDTWQGYFFRSADGGRNWERIWDFTRDMSANPLLPEEGTSGSRLNRTSNITVSPSRPNDLFIAGNRQNVISRDGGRTWTESIRGAGVVVVEDIQFYNGETYVAVMDQGLLSSADEGSHWRHVFPRRTVDGVNGHMWQVRILPGGGGQKIIATMSPWGQPNRIVISENGGQSFEPVSSGLPAQNPKVNTMWDQGYPRALAVDPNAPQRLYLGIDGDDGGGIFKSLDGGRSWNRLPNQPGSRRMFFGLAVDPTDSDRIFWGANADGGGVYRTEDGGTSWRRVFDREKWIFNLRVSGSGRVYAGYVNLWRSLDHGNTWTKLTSFSKKIPIVGMEIDPLDENRIWISRRAHNETAEGGVYRTMDGGTTWEDITRNLPYVKPSVLRYNPETGVLWAGGVSVFKIKQ